jgi:hypothetical protein
MIPEKTRLLVQKRFLRSTHRYEIIGDDAIEITHKWAFRSSNYRVSLNTLDKDAVHQRNFPMAACVTAIALSVITLTFLILWIRSSGPDGLSFVWLAVFFAVLACIAWITTYQRQYNVLTFSDRFTRTRVLVFEFNEPDQQSFDSFCESLRKSIEHAYLSTSSGPDTGSVADQIAKLKKLLDTGALSEAEYQKAKDQLLDRETPRPIGFHAQ